MAWAGQRCRRRGEQRSRWTSDCRDGVDGVRRLVCVSAAVQPRNRPVPEDRSSRQGSRAAREEQRRANSVRGLAGRRGAQRRGVCGHKQEDKSLQQHLNRRQSRRELEPKASALPHQTHFTGWPDALASGSSWKRSRPQRSRPQRSSQKFQTTN